MEITLARTFTLNHPPRPSPLFLSLRLAWASAIDAELRFKSIQSFQMQENIHALNPVAPIRIHPNRIPEMRCREIGRGHWRARDDTSAIIAKARSPSGPATVLISSFHVCELPPTLESAALPTPLPKPPRCAAMYPAWASATPVRLRSTSKPTSLPLGRVRILRPLDVHALHGANE